MRQTEENRGMKKVRESIEWNFGKLRQLWMTAQKRATKNFFQVMK